MGFVVDAILDALSWALTPKSTWGFILRAAALIAVIVVVAELV